jgi:hypothetical protein
VGDRVALVTLDRRGVTVSRVHRLEAGELSPLGADEVSYRSEQIVVTVMSAAHGKRSGARRGAGRREQGCAGELQNPGDA